VCAPGTANMMAQYAARMGADVRVSPLRASDIQGQIMCLVWSGDDERFRPVQSSLLLVEKQIGVLRSPATARLIAARVVRAAAKAT
jgi:hypothetical protein